MKTERQAEIDKSLEEAKAYHHKVFGPNGLLFLKRQELVKPELDRIVEAVKRVCEAHRLDYLIDKSNDHMVFMYTNPVHDYTDFVLDELGLGNKNDVIR